MPRVTGTVERPGYRIEKVTFESRPRLYVTANLYVPAGTGRRPAILGPLGHSVNGKAWPSYQKLFSNLARKGYVVLAYDPFGQGERIEYPGSRPGQSALGRRNERARVRGTPPHPARRQLRPVPRVGRHPRDRLPADARGSRSRADRLLRPVGRRDADAVPGRARQPDPRRGRLRWATPRTLRRRTSSRPGRRTTPSRTSCRRWRAGSTGRTCSMRSRRSRC